MAGGLRASGRLSAPSARMVGWGRVGHPLAAVMWSFLSASLVIFGALVGVQCRALDNDYDDNSIDNAGDVVIVDTRTQTGLDASLTTAAAAVAQTTTTSATKTTIART